MLTHENIWTAIDRLAASFGYSASGLAKQAGLDPTSFNKSKRISPEGKPRWPSTESISRILTATGATMNDFIALIDSDASTHSNKAEQTLPLIHFTQTKQKEVFDKNGNPTGDLWDHVQFPDMEMNKTNIFAIEVSGNSLMPLYRNGDILIVSPNAPIRRGDRIVIRNAKGVLSVQEVLKKQARKLDLKSVCAKKKTISYTSKDIDWTARILWVSQ